MLATFFQELNTTYFRGELPPPLLDWNSRLSSTAGRFCPGSRGRFFQRSPKIEVASYLRDIPDGATHVRDTVLHEMIHYYLWHKQRPYGHTPEFYEIMERVGAKRFNDVPKERPVKYLYACPSCQKKVPAKRRMDRYACADCCEKYSGGKFSDRFRLRLANETAPMKAAPTTPEKTNAPLPPQEIVRRLEELKKLLFGAR